ncbi:MAG: carbamoyl-phosphate synthase [Labilithrix sp.]|nr:carbamoyl-phosphate synthase [Labilithrix sp.]MCW5812157.1 carbamoyl-phosphate synthase [Labilithrix sp.]
MSVLLLGADYYGTLAAARAYGRAGIRVVMADDNRQARALYSKHVSEKLTHPPLSKPNELIDWLVDYGKKNPGTLLYPPNDHLAWLYAAHRTRLDSYFSMFTPPEDAVFTLLDKKRLHAACANVGIEHPVTLALAEISVDSTFVRAVPFPVLLKPRTQVYLTSGIKGFIAHDHVELAAELKRFEELVAFDPVLTDRHPDVAEPMLQEYLTAAETNIFSVSGFVTLEGEVVARGALKVLQRPRKVGIGLCFEGRPVEQPLAEKIGALCRSIGYYGAFESEFIVYGKRRLLIDFNPRFYSQMGFDIARGLPIPQLVWHAARGEKDEVAALVAKARAWRSKGDEVYCHKTMLDLVLSLQGLSGQMTAEEVKRWRVWYAKHKKTATDAVRDDDDKMPAVVDAAQWVSHFARHPRSFVRSFVLNR